MRNSSPRSLNIFASTGITYMLAGNSRTATVTIAADAPFATAIAPEYSASSTYAVGDHCMHPGKYYECTTAIATSEDWTAAHWTQTSAVAQIGNVEALLAAL